MFLKRPCRGYHMQMGGMGRIMVGREDLQPTRSGTNPGGSGLGRFRQTGGQTPLDAADDDLAGTGRSGISGKWGYGCEEQRSSELGCMRCICVPSYICSLHILVTMNGRVGRPGQKLKEIQLRQYRVSDELRSHALVPRSEERRTKFSGVNFPL